LKAVILGIVEGVTEFLPISSTGHLIAAAALLRFNPDLMDTFVIFIQLGAVLAVILFYARELIELARGAFTSPAVRRFWLALIIATLPAAAVGFALRRFIRDVLFHPVPIAGALIVGGLILIAIERRRSTAAPAAEPARPDAGEAEARAVTLRQALLIGAAQTVALFPGVSRSAASIVGGMAVGLSRLAATRFSFYLAIPTLGGATVADLLLSLDELNTDDLLLLLIGLVTSAIVAWLSIRWLLRFVAQHTFIGFGYYRITAGIAILILAFLRII
ncbi:MAG: undecaprenyl-diphosphate phosphatase, partial [Candidatus Flexifilum sp.]